MALSPPPGLRLGVGRRKMAGKIQTPCNSRHSKRGPFSRRKFGGGGTLNRAWLRTGLLFGHVVSAAGRKLGRKEGDRGRRAKSLGRAPSGFRAPPHSRRPPDGCGSSAAIQGGRVS